MFSPPSSAYFCKVFQQFMSVFCQYRFWMKLHTVYRKFPVMKPHNHSIVGRCINLQTLWKSLLADHQGMITCHLILPWKMCIRDSNISTYAAKTPSTIFLAFLYFPFLDFFFAIYISPYYSVLICYLDVKIFIISQRVWTLYHTFFYNTKLS